MSSGNRTFIDCCLQGEAIATDIDNFIDDWHDGPADCELHEYLGMTFDEYRLWVEQPRALKHIIHAKRLNVDVSSILTQPQTYSLAARTTAEAEELVRWLRTTNRLPQ